MGIIKATISAVDGALSDQWKEAFFCGEMGTDILIQRGSRLSSQNSSNQGSNNVITEGSVIVVGEGECAIVTENGKIVGIYDQPGEQTFCSEKSSGIFTGGMKAFAKDVGRRISFGGGDAPNFQRLLYINTKELPGTSFVSEAVPFRFRDMQAAIDIDGTVSCSGTYSFRITDPEHFYKVYARSAVDKSRDALLRQMHSELLTALGPALAELSKEGVRPSETPQFVMELSEKIQETVSKKWKELRGIEACSVAFSSVRVLDGKMMQTAQRDTAFLDPTRAAAHLVGAVSDTMQTAAENTSGTAPLLAAAVQGQSATKKEEWNCSCGHSNKGKFCEDCGSAKPVKWHCVCGTENEGKFCVDCGKPKPTA